MFNYKREVEKLIKWAHAYYVLDNPLATDEEYDTLYHKVLDYEKEHSDKVHPNSPTRRIGGVSEKFNKVKHEHRMWSQEDIFTDDELVKWLSNKKGLSFKLEPKYDGLSLKLIYNEGVLTDAITRGDGRIGESVYGNAILINTIPLSIGITHYIEVSGEVTLYKKDFDALNLAKEINNEKLYANPRNAAAGILRSLDQSVIKKANLVFHPWDIYSKDIVGYSRSETYKADLLKDLGFKHSPFNFIHDNIDAIRDTYKWVQEHRPSLSMLIDGLMIKIDDAKLHDVYGYTNKYPKWSCAYKFPAVEKTTKVLNIIDQVGRTGVITPVAILSPTLIDGSTVERVTLHNYSEIEKKDIRINDQVVLIKSGDIIPKIIKVFKDRRTGLEIKVEKPTVCPECKTKLETGDIDIRCVNENCPSRIIRFLMFFAGRDYMNIEGLGESVATALVKTNLVRDVRDLYTLSKEKLELLDGFQDKKINNLLKSIEDSKSIELYKFVAALGISSFGRTVSKKVCDVYSYDIFRLNYDDLIKINGVGDEIASNFINYMEKNKSYVMDLFSLVKPKDSGSIKGKYSKMDVVLTGSMHVGKDAVKDIIEKQGGNIKSSVSKTTDLVVYGNKAGNKLNKAKELNIETISYLDVIR